MDPIAEWLADKVVFEPNARATVENVRTSYAEHCAATGRMKLGASKFNEQLEERGCQQQRLTVDGQQQRCWVGLRLS